MLRSQILYLICPPMIRSFDFFLLIDIPFSSAQHSHVSIALSRLPSPILAIFMSSAKIYGYSTFNFKIISVRSLVKMLKRRQEIAHPYPRPLPICWFPSFDSITRLLNISWTPWIVLSCNPSSLILSNRSLWLTTSYALAKSTNKIHTGSSLTSATYWSYRSYTFLRSL